MAFKYIGTVSHGTMRAEDLIPAFISMLDTLKEDRSLTVGEQDKEQYTRHDDLCAAIEQRQASVSDYYASDDASYDLESLFDALDEYAPDYCYFGAHEGDGSDYGFWLSHDAIEDARQDGELPSGDELPDAASGMFLQVSDHGNMTLYAATDSGEWREVWGIV